jgi:hypothetical protein
VERRDSGGFSISHHLALPNADFTFDERWEFRQVKEPILFNLVSHVRREVPIMLNSVLQRLSILTIGFSVASTSSGFVTQSQRASSRTIVVDLEDATGR